MLVCECNEVKYDAIKEAVKKHGDNLDAIMEETDAGTTCGCCLEKDCDKVDLPLPLAIKKALEELA
ncbi:(2Fe-2S)-binding protein [Candidatus Sulfurimonas baltica]|uniref:(2Fe-2S)-binding protein n=1 Tax=Candidatus Sulfurimonas baltica TaxID=2740404 RepID=A0A7S7LVL2_9BACT|nr:(2Fe-2S)-binding protein [Candidatus Sulfurimonas baltica]QOY52176.1 (2Fe-2S)-binding protein [Candidatus Sulfurimonas baltica]